MTRRTMWLPSEGNVILFGIQTDLGRSVSTDAQYWHIGFTRSSHVHAVQCVYIWGSLHRGVSECLPQLSLLDYLTGSFRVCPMSVRFQVLTACDTLFVGRFKSVVALVVCARVLVTMNSGW